MRRQNGITLVALVLTVIVLLILAGVSISLVVGNNGVLTKSSEAVITNRTATAKEDIEMAWASAESDYWADWAQNSSITKDATFYQNKLNQYLTNVKKENTDVIVTNKGNGTYWVEYTAKDQGTEYDFEINANGKATQLSIEKTKIEITPKDADSSTMSNRFTQAEAAVLYGKPIAYSATSTLNDRAKSNTWRIFYIDTEGEFGNVGSVYLKMDCDSDTSYYKSLSTGVTSTAKELERMAKFNPKWADGATSITLNSNWINNKAMSYLYDEDVWGQYANSIYAEYAIGGVPVELWVESYNSFINNVVKTGTTISPSFYTSDDKVGYKYNNNANDDVSITNLTGSNHMYHPGSGKYYWLASPSGANADRVCSVRGSTSFLNYYIYYTNHAFCPLVCLKSTVDYEIVWDSTTSSYKFQAKTN